MRHAAGSPSAFRRHADHPRVLVYEIDRVAGANKALLAARHQKNAFRVGAPEAPPRRLTR
jgi:hypothetical protein